MQEFENLEYIDVRVWPEGYLLYYRHHVFDPTESLLARDGSSMGLCGACEIVNGICSRRRGLLHAPCFGHDMADLSTNKLYDFTIEV